MSIKAQNYIWDHAQESDNALLALLILADYADQSGYSYPGIAHISKKLRMSDERSARRTLRYLEERRALVIVPRAGIDTDGGKTNGYWLVMPGVNCDSYDDLIRKLKMKGFLIEPKPQREPRRKKGGKRTPKNEEGAAQPGGSTARGGGGSTARGGGGSTARGEGVLQPGGEGVLQPPNPSVNPSVYPSDIVAAEAATVGAGEKPADLNAGEVQTRGKAKGGTEPDFQKREWLYSQAPVTDEAYSTLNKQDQNTAWFSTVCWHYKKSVQTPEEVYGRLTQKTKTYEHKLYPALKSVKKGSPASFAAFCAAYPYTDQASDVALIAMRYEDYLAGKLTSTSPSVSDPKTWTEKDHPSVEDLKKLMHSDLWRRVYICGYRIVESDYWKIVKTSDTSVRKNVLLEWQHNNTFRQRIEQSPYHELFLKELEQVR